MHVLKRPSLRKREQRVCAHLRIGPVIKGLRDVPDRRVKGIVVRPELDLLFGRRNRRAIRRGRALRPHRMRGFGPCLGERRAVRRRKRTSCAGTLGLEDEAGSRPSLARSSSDRRLGSNSAAVISVSGKYTDE